MHTKIYKIKTMENQIICPHCLKFKVEQVSDKDGFIKYQCTSCKRSFTLLKSSIEKAQSKNPLF